MKIFTSLPRIKRLIIDDSVYQHFVIRASFDNFVCLYKKTVLTSPYVSSAVKYPTTYCYWIRHIFCLCIFEWTLTKFCVNLILISELNCVLKITHISVKLYKILWLINLLNKWLINIGLQLCYFPWVHHLIIFLCLICDVCVVCPLSLLHRAFG